jgi:hypothetical protein
MNGRNVKKDEEINVVNKGGKRWCQLECKGVINAKWWQIRTKGCLNKMKSKY